MRFMFGFIFALLDLILVISGITCLIIGSILNAQYVSTMTEILLIFGWVGVGAGIGSILSFLGIYLMVK